MCRTWSETPKTGFLASRLISDRQISIKRTVELPFTVTGIAINKDKLVVTSPPSVKLIDKSGQVCWSTKADQQGRNLFSCPDYVTCYDDGGSATVIISDRRKDTLTLLNADTGKVIATRQVGWKGPEGVTTDTAGNIYVCYRRTDEVAVLSKDLSQEKVLLSKRDGLCKGPQAIAYNAVDHQLLLSYFSEIRSVSIDCFQ